MAHAHAHTHTHINHKNVNIKEVNIFVGLFPFIMYCTFRCVSLTVIVLNKVGK